MKSFIPSMAAWFNKWLVISFLPACLYINGNNPAENLHPLHISVVEMNYSSEDKTLEITCKIFRDDFERALAKINKTKVDLINPPSRPAMETLVNNYIYQHLKIKTQGKELPIEGIGFEFEKREDAVYAYFQAEKLGPIKNLELTNSLMHDMFTDQQNIVHVSVGGERKSSRLDYPKSEASFAF